jgi:hypothetical protein
MESFLLQLSGAQGVGGTQESSGLASQLGGGMDLVAFNLKRGLNHRDVEMGLAAAMLREGNKVNERCRQIMQA